MKYFFYIIVSLILSLRSYTQNIFPYSIELEPVIPKGFTGLHSFAWAKAGNKVLLIGGRTDGLHKRQPFASFSKKFNNTELLVIDLATETTWRKPVNTLSNPLAEQLQSTNMEFFQNGNQLVITGGYGYSESAKDHITYPGLITIGVSETINAIITGKEISAFIKQVKDERMAVTGGRLNKLGSIYYLVGGQRFTGRYNPHGPDHGPGFLQQYTNQIRKFSITEENGMLQIENYSAITDSALLHRRDYNLLAQYDEKGNEMLTIYAGVFQYNKDIPFTTLVDITKNNYRELSGFNQQFSHYHTATLPAFDKKNNTTYSIFFGGIAQNYQDSAGSVKTDNDVPFVKHISVVERTGNRIREYLVPERFTGYFGAAAEFIPADQNLCTTNGLLKLDAVKRKSVLAGYIIGGIDSRAANVFWSSDAEPSRASPVVWKVYLSKK